MASLLSLDRRIKAAQNVSKTTRAMQMIAASKMKKAQESTLAARPYVEKLTKLTTQVVRSIDKETLTHPYLQQRYNSGKTLLIALSPDKGLCGGLVTNLLREFFNYTKNKSIQYIVVGKKIEAQVAHLTNEVIASFTFGNSTPTFDMVYPIIKLIDDYYLTKRVGSVVILSTEFSSIFSQPPKISTLLPIQLPQDAKITESPYLFEPKVQETLPPLLKHYLEMNIYQYLLESFVSEQASRMIAMQNATDNARDIIGELKLEYNKTRQAKITSEILDISGGATIKNG